MGAIFEAGFGYYFVLEITGLTVVLTGFVVAGTVCLVPELLLAAELPAPAPVTAVALAGI